MNGASLYREWMEEPLDPPVAIEEIDMFREPASSDEPVVVLRPPGHSDIRGTVTAAPGDLVDLRDEI